MESAVFIAVATGIVLGIIFTIVGDTVNLKEEDWYYD